MAAVKNFEDPEIRKKARIVTKQVYDDFNTIKDFGFKDQILQLQD
jgi:hypothetical protein